MTEPWQHGSVDSSVMAPQLFRIFLVLVVLYAFVRGGRDERIVALLCICGAAATLAVISPLQHRFDDVELGVLLIDGGLFLGFLGVALRSSRFWPLWVAGLQLTTIVGHGLKGFDTDLFPNAYAAAINLWSYPIVLILAIGTWRRYRYAEGGPDTF